MQYIYDATSLIAEEYGVLADWDTMLLRQLTFLVGSAHARREKRTKAAEAQAAANRTR